MYIFVTQAGNVTTVNSHQSVAVPVGMTQYAVNGPAEIGDYYNVATDTLVSRHAEQTNAWNARQRKAALIRRANALEATGTLANTVAAMQLRKRVGA